jgi:D-3-phosphoglycerate dehydrogenase
MHVLVTTFPFGSEDRDPVARLSAAGFEVSCNQFGRKIRREELMSMIQDVDIVIAGTEQYDRDVLNQSPRLKLISRVGVGYDAIDLEACKSRQIDVLYTPDAASRSVAELVIWQTLGLIRGCYRASTNMMLGIWERNPGLQLTDLTVGLIGVGNIGRVVLNSFLGMGVKKIIVNDIRDLTTDLPIGVDQVSRDELLRQSDVVSIHVPCTPLTAGMVDDAFLGSMKRGSYLINTARGELSHLDRIVTFLESRHLAGAAIDVFTDEPYLCGDLLPQNLNLILTPHHGSMTRKARALMEDGAVSNVLRYFEIERGVVTYVP